MFEIETDTDHQAPEQNKTIVADQESQIFEAKTEKLLLQTTTEVK